MPRPDRDTWMQPHPSLTRKTQKSPHSKDRPKRSPSPRPSQSASKPKPAPRPAVSTAPPPNPPQSSTSKPKPPPQPKKPQQQRKWVSISGKWLMKAQREGIALYFAMYGKEIEAKVVKNDTYDLRLRHGGKVEVVPKLKIQFFCKADQPVKDVMVVDADIKSKSLQPIVPIRKRYQLKDKQLMMARRHDEQVRATMRGGAVFSGKIEWFTQYEIKLLLSNESKVILMRHALLHVEVDTAA